MDYLSNWEVTNHKREARHLADFFISCPHNSRKCRMSSNGVFQCHGMISSKRLIKVGIEIRKLINFQIKFLQASSTMLINYLRPTRKSTNIRKTLKSTRSWLHNWQAMHRLVNSSSLFIFISFNSWNNLETKGVKHVQIVLYTIDVFNSESLIKYFGRTYLNLLQQRVLVSKNNLTEINTSTWKRKW